MCFLFCLYILRNDLVVPGYYNYDIYIYIYICIYHRYTIHHIYRYISYICICILYSYIKYMCNAYDIYIYNIICLCISLLQADSYLKPDQTSVIRYSTKSQKAPCRGFIES